MPAPSLRTVRRLRSQSVETTSGVFMVSPEAVDARQEFSPSRSQVAKKVTRGSGSSERPRFVAMDPHASPRNRSGPHSEDFRNWPNANFWHVCFCATCGIELTSVPGCQAIAIYEYAP